MNFSLWVNSTFCNIRLRRNEHWIFSCGNLFGKNFWWSISIMCVQTTHLTTIIVLLTTTYHTVKKQRNQHVLLHGSKTFNIDKLCHTIWQWYRFQPNTRSRCFLSFHNFFSHLVSNKIDFVTSCVYHTAMTKVWTKYKYLRLNTCFHPVTKEWYDNSLA